MFDPDAINERITEQAAKLLLRDALTLQAEYKRRVSVFNPPPHRNSSKPGQYFKSRTYNARDSIVVEPASLAIIRQTGSVRVGVLVGAQYAAILKARGWKGIADCHAELKAAGKYRSDQ